MATKKDMALLGTIIAAMANADAPYHMATEAEIKGLTKENFVETNAEIRDGDKIAVRATDAGQAAFTAANQPAAGGTSEGNATMTTNSNFVTGTGFVPSQARGGRGRSVYDFDSLEVGGFIFVPVSDDKPNPAKSLASTVSSATQRYAEETGETKKNKKGEDVPVLRETRKFNVQSVKSGVAYGNFTAPADGAVIYRSA
jgi:hypothetical protein